MSINKDTGMTPDGEAYAEAERRDERRANRAARQAALAMGISDEEQRKRTRALFERMGMSKDEVERELARFYDDSPIRPPD